MQDAVTVRDVMSREFLGVSEGDTVDDLLDAMLTDGASTAVVVRGNDPVGIVTERHLLELVAGAESVDDRTVDDVMRAPPAEIGADKDVTEALDILAGVDGRHLPVIDGTDDLVGLLGESDLIAASASLFAGTEHTVREEEVVTADAGGTARSTDAFGNGSPESAPGTAGENGPEDSYSTQSVCESCGSLSGTLAEFNGQLLCPDCRDV